VSNPNTTTEGGKSYPIGSLADIAAIPADVLPRFYAELPVMIAEIQHMQAIVAAANNAVGVEVIAPPKFDGAEWIDDDKRTIDQHVTFEGFEDAPTTVHVRKTFGPQS